MYVCVLAAQRSTTLAIVKPEAVGSAGDIISAVLAAGFDIGRMAMLKFTSADVDAVFSHKSPSGAWRSIAMCCLVQHGAVSTFALGFCTTLALSPTAPSVCAQLSCRSHPSPTATVPCDCARLSCR